MPDFWTHILGGSEIIRGIKNEEIKEIVKENNKVFNFGCQGPDLFFYNDFWPWIKDKRGPEAGQKMHQKKVKELVLNSYTYLKDMEHNKDIDRNDYNRLTAYICGFICHYIIDKTTHPFIFARAGDEQEHKRLEQNIDSYLINKYRGENVCQLPPFKAIYLGKNLPLPIINYYSHVLKEIYNQDKQIDFINDSYQDCRHVLWIFYSPYRIKYNILRFINRLTSIDLTTYSYQANSRLKLLENEGYQEFETFFQQGIGEGRELINLLDDYLDDRVEKHYLWNKLPDYTFTGEKI